MSVRSCRANSTTIAQATALALAILMTSVAHGGTVATPNTFTTGASAQASEVNDNFTAHETEINDNASRIATLEASLMLLTSRVAALESSARNTVSLVVSGDGSIQYSSLAGVTVTRTGVGQYSITIPAGTFDGSDGGVPLITPISAAGELAVANTSLLSNGGVSQTLVFRNDAGTPLDVIFHIIFIGGAA